MRVAVFACASALLSLPAPAQVSVPMSQYDLNRTGANLSETTLSPANVNPAQFGKLFARTVDDTVYALPLVVANVNMPGQGTRNVLYVATMSNTVYAFDADDPARSQPYWFRNLGTPAATDAWIGPYHFGVLGTPFIDVPTGTLYLVAKVQNGTDVGLWVHAIDIYTGVSKFNSPQRMSFPFAGGPVMTNVPTAIQRAGLLVRNGVLYIAVANIRPDPNDYESQEGFLESFNASDVSQRLAVFQSTPTGYKGGMWEAGRGIASDAAGNVYAATAGGTYDGVTNFGSSAIKFAASSLAMLDWFTPYNYDYLFNNNIDLAANGVTLIPNSTLAFAGGKEGVVFLLDTGNMGRLENTDGQPLERFKASNGCGLTDCAQFLGTAFWNRTSDGVLYVWDRGDVLRSYRFVDQRFETAPFATSTVRPVMTGGPAVSANGGDTGSGIVWAVTAAADANSTLVPGTLRAFRASNIAEELYNSDTNAARDAPGYFTKFAPPVIANGKVYVPTQSNAVVVYGLLAGGSTGAQNSAVFLKTDSTTQGNWKSAYGADGYSIEANGAWLPPYAQMAVTGASKWTWAASTTDVRALQKPAAADRIASTWYSFGSYSYDVNLTDGGPHEVALYALDWDFGSRSQRIDVLDGDTGAVLDTRSIEQFTSGVYLAWTLKGHVTVRVTRTGGSNAVVSAMFFGSGPPPSAPAATFVRADTTTQGTWRGMYGSAGYAIQANASSYPAYARVSAAGAYTWTWNASTADVRALQKAGASDRIASCWYHPAAFSLDVNLTDANMHQVAVYMLDWDNRSRSQRVEVLDAAAGTVLDTRSATAFTAGQYLVWNIKGHVRIRVTRTGGDNAVVSGMFFD